MGHGLGPSPKDILAQDECVVVYAHSYVPIKSERWARVPKTRVLDAAVMAIKEEWS